MASSLPETSSRFEFEDLLKGLYSLRLREFTVFAPGVRSQASQETSPQEALDPKHDERRCQDTDPSPSHVSYSQQDRSRILIVVKAAQDSDEGF